MSTPLQPITAKFIDGLDAATIPRRRRVLGWSLIRQQVTLLVAPPGVGKSTLCLAQALAICTGRRLTGQEVVESGRVWIYNNEDGRDEMERRVAALIEHHQIPIKEVSGRLALSSGADRPLLVAKSDKRGGIIRQPDVDACIAIIQQEKIAAFVVDPFIETHEVQENSNEQIKLVAQLYREIAWRGDCAVLLIHHTSKPPQGSAEGHAGNMNSARGASALSGVARVVQTIFSMSPKDAYQFGIPEPEKHLYVRLDDAKANLSLVTGQALWFKRVGVTISNGDEVGILEQVDLSQPRATTSAEEKTHQAIMAGLLAMVAEEQINLNTAARLLAWSNIERFHKYREIDGKNYQRASRTLRDAIAAACRAGTVVSDSLGERGFTIVEGASPVQLRRFAEAPAQPSLFDDGGTDE